MNSKREIRNILINSNNEIVDETIAEMGRTKSASKLDKAKRTFDTSQFDSFYLVNEYVECGKDKKIISSNIISDQKEIIMRSSDEIEVVLLSKTNYLLNSSEQTMIIEIVDGEVEVLTSVSRLKPGAMYKLTEYLNKNGLVVLTNYSPDEKRNFEYLYDYNTGKRISSGFDTIDEVNGKLKVTFGLATGDLDLDGNFIMEPDEEDLRPQGFFARLFNKGKC